MYRDWIRRIFNPLVKGFSVFPPNFLTLLGFVIVLIGVYVLVKGYPFLAGWIILAGSIFDMIDGGVARLKGKTSRFGAFLDSTLDRYSDFFIFTGVALWSKDGLLMYLALASLLGSFITSFARARGEALGVDVKVGFMQRGERVALMILGLILYKYILLYVLGFIAVMTNITAIHRIYHVWKELKKEV